MSKKQLKPVPRFKTEAEEPMYWLQHDTTDYVDSTRMMRARFPNLKPTTQSISIRLPLHLLGK